MIQSKIKEYSVGAIRRSVTGAEALEAFVTACKASSCGVRVRSSTRVIIDFTIAIQAPQDIQAHSVDPCDTRDNTLQLQPYRSSTAGDRFLVAQGYPVEANVLFQDNSSAIKLESNGRASAGKRSRHLDIKHFYGPTRWKEDWLVLSTAQLIKWLLTMEPKLCKGRHSVTTGASS